LVVVGVAVAVVVAVGVVVGVYLITSTIENGKEITP
jgi:hypothetical protein